MTVSELGDFIINNPSVLKHPIIIEDEKMQVGYNDEEIRVFVPRRLRELVMCKDCPNDGKCDYQTSTSKIL